MARTFGSYSPTVPTSVTWEETLVFEDENGDAVDLTGYVVEAQLRATLDDAAVLNLTTQWSIPTPTNGTILLAIEPEDFADCFPAAGEAKSKYLWSIVLRRESDDYRIPLAKGKVTFTREATQYSAADTLAE